MSEMKLSFRYAEKRDVPLILELIRELAGYEKLVQIAVERGCGRLEWSCLDWNQPSIDFYLSLGAEPMKGWTVYRLAGETLKAARS